LSKIPKARPLFLHPARRARRTEKKGAHRKLPALSYARQTFQTPKAGAQCPFPDNKHHQRTDRTSVHQNQPIAYAIFLPRISKAVLHQEQAHTMQKLQKGIYTK